MLSDETVYRLFVHSAARADIAVIEGVMGLFDGSQATGDRGSSAQVAKLLDCPVILIVDVKSMARSAAAMVSGFVNFDPDLKIAGVILNRIGSERHLGLVREAVEAHCKVPVVGYIRKNTKLELPSRHLGLVPTVEGGGLPAKINSLADEIKEGIDFARIRQIADAAADMKSPGDIESAGQMESVSGVTTGSGEAASRDKIRIGLAWDEAFSFYYQDGLDELARQGAELVRFSPLHDAELPPDLDGIYIGGGFPEVFIRELAANTGIINRLQAAGGQGMPIFAECGGLMYLARAIVDFDGQEYGMVGLVPGRCIMEKSLVGMGYIEAKTLSNNVISTTGQQMRGHEFHYSRMAPDLPDFSYAFRLTRNRSRDTVMDGYARDNILASYAHLHFASDPNLAARFIANCLAYRESNKRVR
jgi:cobyrinic acid a,c-diamide synthase